MTRYDLTSSGGLAAALDEAGSWAALSRSSGVAQSTLKSRGARLGLQRPNPTPIPEIPEEIWAFANTLTHAILATVREYDKFKNVEYDNQVASDAPWESRRLIRDSLAKQTQQLLKAQAA